MKPNSTRVNYPDDSYNLELIIEIGKALLLSSVDATRSKAQGVLEVHIPKIKALLEEGDYKKVAEYTNLVIRTNKIPKNPGNIYVISHGYNSDWYKVGVTIQKAEDRLGAYQVADPLRRYKLEYTKLTKHYKIVEKHIHSKYENRAEWVKAPLADIIKEIENHNDSLEQQNKELPPRGENKTASE